MFSNFYYFPFNMLTFYQLLEASPLMIPNFHWSLELDGAAHVSAVRALNWTSNRTVGHGIIPWSGSMPGWKMNPFPQILLVLCASAKQSRFTREGFCVTELQTAEYLTRSFLFSCCFNMKTGCVLLLCTEELKLLLNCINYGNLTFSIVTLYNLLTSIRVVFH